MSLTTQLTKEGLRFFEGCDEIKKNLGTLNGNFVKEGGDFPFCGFHELWVDKNGKVIPGWEIFFNKKLTFKKKPAIMIKEVQEEVNWVDYMDVEAMRAMLKEEVDVLAITIKEPSDPSAFIVPSMGQLNYWTWVRFFKNMGNEFCNVSLDVPFNIFNKMNLKMKLINNWKRNLNIWNQLVKLSIWAIMRIHD